MDLLPTNTLRNETRIVGAIDNNQKFHSLTFQPFGSERKFVKVTEIFSHYTFLFQTQS